ncbi:glycosyltransferase family 2 protein [Stappia sp. F7233]|uniref:Glycosyltransferase family 2 protein n=1 Tax=Stappia albiluteola TaxID=2758565 RepID=A0A839AG24_9HYPH|nr:glycosyltransferase family 2 protein [Stappia albiluteola]MBA5778046.1 glycosyltransferase family 2 protein [Stappia albiluteola]
MLSRYRKIIFVLPEIVSVGNIEDDFYRMLYFAGAADEPDTGYVLFSDLMPEIPQVDCSPYLDGQVIQVRRKLEERTHIFKTGQIAETVKSFGGEKVLWFWDEKSRLGEYRSLATERDTRSVRADHRTVQHAASLCLKFSSNDGKGTQEQLNLSKGRFEKLRASIDTDNIYIFGTGTSLGSVDFDRLDDGEFIATNSMIRNREVLEKMAPRIIVASDPIFHAGPSTYAARFRQDLIDAMRTYGSCYIFPMRDYGAYCAYLPEDLHEKLIPVPISSSHGMNLRFPEDFFVGATSNVMTLFLLPLAASLGKRITLAGFDGRPIGNNEYFWSHSKAFQYDAEMGAIQDAHPAFFGIDYDEYYEIHCRTLKTYLGEIENAGIEVSSITDSFIPAIKGRYVARIGEVAASPARPLVSIIMPAFNVEQYIRSTIETIRSQSLKDFEIVCVDDGSTDNTLEIVRELSRQDIRIKVIEGQRQGVSGARNAGLERANGKYICFADADDPMPAESLAVRVAGLEQAEDGCICFGRTEIIGDDGRKLGIEFGARSEIGFEGMFDSRFHLNSVIGPAHIMKMERFPLGVQYGEDWLYLASVMRHGVKAVPVERVVATYRWHSDSATGSAFRRHSMGLLEVLDVLGKDEPSNIHLPWKYRLGLAGERISAEKLRRLSLLAIYEALKGREVPDPRLLDQIRLYSGRVKKVEFSVRSFEAIAARVFLLPVGSGELKSAIRGRSEALMLVQKELPSITILANFRNEILKLLGLKMEANSEGRTGRTKKKLAKKAHNWLLRIHRATRDKPLVSRISNELARLYDRHLA